MIILQACVAPPRCWCLVLSLRIIVSFRTESSQSSRGGPPWRWRGLQPRVSARKARWQAVLQQTLMSLTNRAMRLHSACGPKLALRSLLPCGCPVRSQPARRSTTYSEARMRLWRKEKWSRSTPCRKLANSSYDGAVRKRSDCAQKAAFERV